MKSRFSGRSKNEIPELRRLTIKTIWWKYAAAAIIVLGVGLGIAGYFDVFNRPPEKTVAQLSADQISDVAPPSVTNAVLTLANGRTILLDSAGDGSLAMRTI